MNLYCNPAANGGIKAFVLKICVNRKTQEVVYVCVRCFDETKIADAWEVDTELPHFLYNIFISSLICSSKTVRSILVFASDGLAWGVTLIERNKLY